MVESCSNCMHWDAAQCCMAMESDGGEPPNPQTRAFAISDHIGPACQVRTHPQFHCSMWQQNNGQ